MKPGLGVDASGSAANPILEEEWQLAIDPPVVEFLAVQSVERLLGITRGGTKPLPWLSAGAIEESLETMELPPALYIFLVGWAANCKLTDNEIKVFSDPSNDERILTFGPDLHFTTAYIDKKSRTVTFNGRDWFSLEFEKDGVNYTEFTKVIEALRLGSYSGSLSAAKHPVDRDVFFTIHNFECIVNGYEPIAFECAPEMLRENYATAISKDEKHQVHQQVFSGLLSRYRKENRDTIIRGRASYEATLAILDPLAHTFEAPFQSLPDPCSVTSSPVARCQLSETTLIASGEPCA